MMRRPRCCYPARTAGYEIAVELDVLAVDVVPLDQRVQNGRRCICLLLSHSTTRTWASCQGLIPVWSVSVLLRRFLWHAGSQKIICCVTVFNTLTKQTQTQTLCVSSTRSHTPVPKRFLFISTSQVRQAFPSSQRLVSICARDWRLLQLDRYLASMIRPAMTLVVSPPKLSAPTPARGLPTPPRP